jgi:hypothetical protein
MDEISDPASLVEAAQQAAAAGDYPTAAYRLRDAAEWQERQLGPDHPDLVNTLNNLGVVLERSRRLEEAEGAYRRAYAIARKVFDASHPFVVTSAANLREFCEAHGVAFGPSAPAPEGPAAAVQPAAVVESPAVGAPAVARQPAAGGSAAGKPAAVEARAKRAAVPAAPEGRTWKPAAAVPDALDEPRRGSSMRVVAIAGTLAVVLGITWLMTRSSEQATSSAVSSEAGSERGDAAPTTGKPSQESPATRGGSVPGAAAREEPARPADRSAGSPAGFSIVDAELCQTLVTRPGAAEWTCTPAGASVPPGRLAYYTRVRSSSDVSVEHRWYRGDVLQQRVELPVQANPASGYRTYSRRTIGTDEAGAWRVELRSESGALLREQRFVVR